MGDRPPADTDQPAPRPRRKPGAYYYDDQTGYEPYDPAHDEGEDDTREDETQNDDRATTTDQT